MNKNSKSTNQPEELPDLPECDVQLPNGTNLTFLEFFKLCEKELPYTNLNRDRFSKFEGNFEPFTFKD